MPLTMKQPAWARARRSRAADLQMVFTRFFLTQTEFGGTLKVKMRWTVAARRGSLEPSSDDNV